jgi:hypothetical protein
LIIPIDEGKAFDKIKHQVMIKILNKLGVEESNLNSIKDMCEKPISKNKLNRERLNTFPPKCGRGPGCSPSPLLGKTT